MQPLPSPSVRVWLVAVVAVAAVGAAASGDTIEDGCDGVAVSWRPRFEPANARVATHVRSSEAPHRGERCELLVVVAQEPVSVRLDTDLGPAALIDELRAAVWVRSSQPGIRLSVRVRLARPDGVEVLVPGTFTRDAGQWERIEVDNVPRRLARQLPALRLEHGAALSSQGAVVTGLALDVPAGPGRHDVAVDDVFVTGAIPAVRMADPLVRTVAASAPTSDPLAGLARGVLEVDGLPFFPRSIDWTGESFETLASLGFNCVRLPTPASSDQLAEARAAGLWVICPPPPIPDVDLTEPERVPMLRNWDRVLAWDLGTGLREDTVEELAERGRRIRACDPRPGRPLIGSADSGLRFVSRHVDMLVARRTVLGTTLELVDWLEWLRQRPRLARPGTPFLTTLATDIDTSAARQAAALAGVGGHGLAVDPETLKLAAFSAIAGGVRGILFTSSQRLDTDEAETRMRAAAVRDMNLQLAILGPWGAAGRFASRAQTSSPEVQAFVMEAARSRIVLAWRCVQGSQVVARRYEGADVPGDDVPLSILVPGVPEAHQAWEITVGGLRPVRQQRVTGGVSVTLDDFTTHAMVLFSGEPTVTSGVQSQLRSQVEVEVASARSLAALSLAAAGDLVGRLPPQAFSGPPPVAAVPMLTEAGRLASPTEATDAASACRGLRRAAAVAGQFERRIWENAIKAEGSMVASPLTCSDATLAEAWQFIAAKAQTTPGEELLSGGEMERLEPLAQGGWRHFARSDKDILTSVEVSQTRPASGRGCLRLVAAPSAAAAAPVVVETPPVWVTTPPLTAPAGKLLEITAQVLVPKPIQGSVDGFMVFDSLGGPALAERVGQTRDWRRLVLHRVVPAEAAGEPLVVTFALSGLGEARLDDVSVRVLERSSSAGEGPRGSLVSAPRQPAEGPRFPSPADLLPPASRLKGEPAAAAAPPAWPGASLGWPKLLPFGSPNAPPPGPGGGTVDPFKRARVNSSAAP